jgi:predicted transport protein
MALYKNDSGSLAEIKELKIERESDLQKLTEANLQTIFGLLFISTEFEHNGLRLDSVAFDAESKAFVIIEYKRDKSISVIDQGYAYLALMLNNKAEFILLYQEHTGKQLAKNDIDWSQSRVMFLAQSFTTHQQQSINFRDMPIELWQVSVFDNKTLLYSQLKAKESSSSIKTITKNKDIQSVSKEVKVYDVTDHFKGSREVTLGLYETLRDRLTSLAPAVSENPRGNYIGFSLRENGFDTFAYVHVQVGSLRVDIPRIRPEDINDPSDKVSYQLNSFETKNTPTSIIYVKDEDDIDYAAGIIRQVLKLKFK